MKLSKFISGVLFAVGFYNKSKEDEVEKQTAGELSLLDSVRAVEDSIAQYADSALDSFNNKIDLYDLDYSKVVNASLVVNIGCRKRSSINAGFVLVVENKNSVPIYLKGILIRRWDVFGNDSCKYPFFVGDIKLPAKKKTKINLFSLRKTNLWDGSTAEDRNGKLIITYNNDTVKDQIISLGEGNYTIGSADVEFVINANGNMVARELNGIESFVYYAGNVYFGNSAEITFEIKEWFDSVLENSYK